MQSNQLKGLFTLYGCLLTVAMLFCPPTVNIGQDTVKNIEIKEQNTASKEVVYASSEDEFKAILKKEAQKARNNAKKKGKPDPIKTIIFQYEKK